MDVDAALVRLARERGASLITVDHNLAKVAEALRVPVAQINALASKFRVPYTAGDEIAVRLVKEGREHGQGVGYLDDGTMVVVEKADEHIGTTVEVKVTNVIQTTTGRMVFAALATEAAAEPASRRLPCLPHGDRPLVPARIGDRAGRRRGPAAGRRRAQGVRDDRRPAAAGGGRRGRRGLAVGRRSVVVTAPAGLEERAAGLRGVPRQAGDRRDRRGHAPGVGAARRSSALRRRRRHRRGARRRAAVRASGPVHRRDRGRGGRRGGGDPRHPRRRHGEAGARRRGGGHPGPRGAGAGADPAGVPRRRRSRARTIGPRPRGSRSPTTPRCWSWPAARCVAVPGDAQNFKITTLLDLARAESRIGGPDA